MAVVTISRQFGAGGEEVAQLLGELLDYRYFDKQLLAQTAAEVGLSEEEVVDYNETSYKVRDWLTRLVAPGPRIVREFMVSRLDEQGRETLTMESLDEAQCVTLIQRAIRAAFQQGNMVIVGRGGQAVLKDQPEVLHVRLEAPLDVRIMRIEDRDGLSYSEAEELVRRRDTAAAAYLQRFYDIDWNDPLLYHMVLNTGRWTVAEAAKIIADAVDFLVPGI
jgi:cytidylate kinase